MDERPLDPVARVPAEAHDADGDGGSEPAAGAQPDRDGDGHDGAADHLRPLPRQPGTGSFILIDPATKFTAGAGMIIDAIREDHAAEYRPNAAERLVQIARSAASHEEAVAAMQRALEELLK